MALHGQVERSFEGVPANRVSVAGLSRVYRDAMRESLIVPEPGQSLWDRLKTATVDTDRRRSKTSRGYPQKKQEKPTAAPKIRPATPQEIELAKQIKEDHKLGLTA